MKIDIIKVGYLEENCYFLIKDNDLIIIDPGDEFNKIDSNIKSLNLIGIIITHHHFDHVGALDELVNKYHVPVYDYSNLKEGINNIKNFTFNVIKTPGHTLDSITIYFEKEKIMFVGDFIFNGSIGRTDLGGNDIDMKESLQKISKYNNVKIYPGHGPSTTLEYEKENNLFF